MLVNFRLYVVNKKKGYWSKRVIALVHEICVITIHFTVIINIK